MKTLELIKDLEKNPDRYTVNDEWTLGQYRAFMESGNGYPYLETVAEWIEKTNSLVLDATEHKNLVTLVYNAAKEYREAKDKADGFFTVAEAEPFINKSVELKRDSIFGTSLVLGKLLKTERGYFVLPKGKRTRGYMLDYTSKLRAYSGGK